MAQQGKTHLVFWAETGPYTDRSLLPQMWKNDAHCTLLSVCIRLQVMKSLADSGLNFKDIYCSWGGYKRTKW